MFEPLSTFGFWPFNASAAGSGGFNSCGYGATPRPHGYKTSRSSRGICILGLLFNIRQRSKCHYGIIYVCISCQEIPSILVVRFVLSCNKKYFFNLWCYHRLATGYNAGRG